MDMTPNEITQKKLDYFLTIKGPLFEETVGWWSSRVTEK